MQFTHQGREYLYKGETQLPLHGEHFLGAIGVIQADHDFIGVKHPIVYPVPITHEFGGVKFEEENARSLHPNEWYLNSNGRPRYSFVGSPDIQGTFQILRPVKGE